MRPISLVVLACCATLSTGASGEEPAKEHPAKDAPPAREMNETSVRLSSRDTRIPKPLVERIEKDYKEFLKKQGGAKDVVRREFLNVNVEFTRARAGALREDTLVRTPTGGGIVDLADVITPLKGAFNVKFLVATPDAKPVAAVRVFFVSHARRRILDGEAFGDGCGKFMEITTKFHRQWEKEGFGLFSADQRDVSVLGGTFLFVDFEPDALRVAALSFTDSRYPKLLCEE